MAQAALSYQQPQRRTRELEYPERPPLRVIPGSAPSTVQKPALAPFWRLFFKVSVAVILFVGLLFVARVGLADATMLLYTKSAQISKSIEAERAEGASKEAEFLLASNPARILEEASHLGMAPDQQIGYLHITLGE